MTELLVVHVESMSAKLLQTVRDVPMATTGMQMKQILSFRHDSELSPKLLLSGGLMDDAAAFSQFEVESEVILTLVFSVEWGSFAKHKVMQELRSIGALAADSALAAMSSAAMPLDAREWGLSHLQSLGASGWRVGADDVERYGAALAAVIIDDPAHWLRSMAVEALHDLGLAPAHLSVLIDAAHTDGNQGVRYCCMKTVGKVGRQALQVALEVASTLIIDSSAAVRIAAAQALGNMGPAVLPEGGIALLEATSADPEEENRHEANVALKKLMHWALDSRDADRLSKFSCMLEENADALSKATYGQDAIRIARGTLAEASSKLHVA